MITTAYPHSDMAARTAVFALVALALWSGVRQLERPTNNALAQDIILLATATPALPTPPLAELPALSLPTPEPLPAPAAAGPAAAPASAPVWTDDAAPAPTTADTSADYIANVGAQADHCVRGCTVEYPPVYTGGPILYPDENVIIVPAESLPSAPVLGPAVAVPQLTSEQAAVLSSRTSATCPSGQVFYPRTGCHLPGSGGPMPGAVGETRP